MLAIINIKGYNKYECNYFEFFNWEITINGTINYMWRGIMIFRRGIDITRGIGGLFWALELPERIWAH